MPASLQLASLALEVIKLAVDNDMNPFVLVRDQLIAGREVNDAQPRMAETDALIGGPTILQKLYQEGVPVRIFGTGFTLADLVIFAKDDKIKSLADLKGKLIGVVSMQEGTTFFVKDIAKKGGFDVADVKVQAVGGSPTRARLLKERKIDAGLQPYPLSYEAEAAGFSNLGPIADLVPDYQFTSVVVDETWARANRPVLVVTE